MGRLTVCYLPVLSVLIAACGNNAALPSDFENAARETAPVMSTQFQQMMAAFVGDNRAINPDLVIDRVYATLCDYRDDPDCTVGVENVYHALRDVDGAASDTFGGNRAGPITIPFFGDTKEYSSKRSGPSVAWRVDGDVLHLLYLTDASNGTSVYDTELNQATGDLSLRLAGLWSMAGQGSLGLRAEISGNRNTHRFTLRIATADPSDPVKPFMTVRGAGTSRGAGNHFLFRVNSTNTADGAAQNGYHCVDAALESDVAGNDVQEAHADCGGPTGNIAQTVDNLAELTLDDLPAAPFATSI